MRTELQTDLDLINEMLVAMAEAVRAAIGTATTALLTADRDAAQTVIAGDARINDLCLRIEDRVQDTTARQAPVASDLRAMFAALHVAADLERMGDLAKHIAKTALRAYPTFAIPSELAPLFGQMAGVADRMAAKMARVLSEPDVHRAVELDKDDNAMDGLHRDLLAQLLDASWSHNTQTAIDAALLGRFYERYADHVVNAGRWTVFLVTGMVLPG
jgi:phosphate transport system protein